MEDYTSEISSSDEGEESDTMERESLRMAASRCHQTNGDEGGRKALRMMSRSNGDVSNYGLLHNTTRRTKKLSFTIRLVMTTALIYFHRILTAERRCFHCQIDRIKKKMQKRRQNSEEAFKEALRNSAFDNTNQGYETTDKEILSLSKGDLHLSTDVDCAVCNSYWWNYYGEVQKYADKDLGLNIATSYGRSVMSITVTAASILVVVYDLVYYVRSLWGKQHQIIHALSYGTFMVKLLLFPTMSIISKIRSWTQTRSPGLYWSTALNARYIVKRLQFLDIPNRGIPAKCVLFSIYACCLFMMVYRGWIYWTLCHSFSFHSGISVFCGGFIMLMWGNFQYLMYVVRVSFQRQVVLVRKCIEKHQHDLDFCRRVLGSAKQDFNCFRKLAAVYMIVFVPTTIWSITTSITTDYYMARDNHSHFPKLRFLRNHIAILIWVENFVFLFVSIWAIGGVNAEYIWKNFHLRLVTMSRNQKHSGRFWHKIMKHMKNIEDDYHGIDFAIVFAVITFFMALELGDIQVTTFVIQEPFCVNLTDLESF
ncbi:hypothetical protein HOLleu_18054 [Holothuria leucospilota]|uniref:Uncharacterized protein n=1 Tax=Holothuria leucospilota TaxID=206669 RepID=A0A9Q1H8T0_HOLLE|nr:hypothetical protein HOLleu_18054 [Holothuria leucospilota]